MPVISRGGPIKVAVIGGGCASIAAAFELSRPEHQGKYQVTVYQLGWRLGGKGASGRGPANRIEEHGFHVWLGYYENSFRLLRECYAELSRDRSKRRIADWRDAFTPAPFISLAGTAADGKCHSFLFHFPPDNNTLPGDPLTIDSNPFSVGAYLLRTAGLLRTILLATLASQLRGDGCPDGVTSPDRSAGKSEDGNLGERITRFLKLGVITGAAAAVQALALLENALSAAPEQLESLALPLLEAIAATARKLVEDIGQNDPKVTLIWEAIDLGATVMLGIIRFGLVSDPRGFDAINDYEFRHWMRLNGASERSLKSPMVRGCYDLAFAYKNGDRRTPSLAAGVALRGSMRMLIGYRGSIFWKMRAGMGDVVFAPMYEVLKRRGVSFKFFHRLTRVNLAPKPELRRGERPYVKSLDFALQARVIGDEYQPLIDLDGLPCWPSNPDFSQLVDGARLREEASDFESNWNRKKCGTRTLQLRRDFDFVVLGIGLGAIPEVCAQLIRRERRWRDMVAHLATVETQAFQIWLGDEMQTLGWDNPAVSLTAFAHPFETWADMGHLLEEERWPQRPRALAYFCGPLPCSPKGAALSDSSYPARRRDQVRRNAIAFLNSQVVQLWPKAARPQGGFKWEALADYRENGSGPQTRPAGEARFDSQYWRANVNPSDRYVLSLPGTQRYRISPLDNTFDNLTVAGDWTACSLDSGCVEAAVISGRLAAHAISASPALEEIPGYDHP